MFPLRDSVEHHGPALLTKALIGLNVLIFFWQISGPPASLERSVVEYGFVPALFFADPVGEAFRLFTSMFLHGGLGHILGNMWFLWVFGPALEGRLGALRFLVLYIVAGLAAALLQGGLMPDAEVPMVGASGAISGVLGGYLIRFSRAWILTMVWVVLPLFFWVPAAIYIVFWIGLQLLYAGAGVPGVAWWAHIGGFAGGLMLAAALADRHPYKAPPYWRHNFEFD